MVYKVEKKAVLNEKDRILKILNEKAEYIKDNIKKDIQFISNNINQKNFDCKRDFLMIYHKDKYHSTLFDKFVYFSKKLMLQMLDTEQYNRSKYIK